MVLVVLCLYTTASGLESLVLVYYFVLGTERVHVRPLPALSQILTLSPHAFYKYSHIYTSIRSP